MSNACGIHGEQWVQCVATEESRIAALMKLNADAYARRYAQTNHAECDATIRRRVCDSNGCTITKNETDFTRILQGATKS